MIAVVGPTVSTISPAVMTEAAGVIGPDPGCACGIVTVAPPPTTAVEPIVNACPPVTTVLGCPPGPGTATSCPPIVTLDGLTTIGTPPMFVLEGAA